MKDIQKKKKNGKTEVLHMRNTSKKIISEELKRSRHLIQNYLKSLNAYGKIYSSGCKGKLSKQSERAIVWKVSNCTKSLVQIKSKFISAVHKNHNLKKP